MLPPSLDATAGHASAAERSRARTGSSRACKSGIGAISRPTSRRRSATAGGERRDAREKARQLAERLRDARAVPGGELAVDQVDAALAHRRDVRVRVEV